ncbi:MAG: hypothetical protein IPI60_00320 [Saprospiraceae bacterium]|nr:hypothetical protein [Saprospiraceae bacterium]
MDSVIINFKDQEGFKLNDKLKPQLSIALPNRALNLFKKYIIARKKARANRNPISKILEYKTDVLVNQKNLTSKVLLVAGRGQVKKFHEFLESVEIYGEKLGRVFVEGKNLIITPDFKKYRVLANPNAKNDESEFIQVLSKALDVSKFEVIAGSIQELLDIYNHKGTISDEFDNQFNDLINEAIENIPELKILKEKYPGISESVSDDFRAVIINDIQ